MNQHELLAEQFEEHRARLRGIAYRMLGSQNEADDALQEAWLRIIRSDTGNVINLGAWLTTVVAHTCLDMLRSRKSRREEPLDTHVPDPIISPADALDPEQEVLLAESIGLALLVVLDTLNPAERLAFVLHDLFAVPFEEIAAILGRSVESTRQLASRARRRVRGANPASDGDQERQREVVDAFFAATRSGDFEALVAVLDPEVVMRVDGGLVRRGDSVVVRGAQAVARQLNGFVKRSARPTATIRPALVNGTPGGIVVADRQPLTALSFSFRNGKIAAIDILADSTRLEGVDPAILGIS